MHILSKLLILIHILKFVYWFYDYWFQHWNFDMLMGSFQISMGHFLNTSFNSYSSLTIKDQRQGATLGKVPIICCVLLMRKMNKCRIWFSKIRAFLCQNILYFVILHQNSISWIGLIIHNQKYSFKSHVCLSIHL